MNSAKKGKGGEALKKIILRSVGDLPPMPQTVFKVRDIIANPKSSFKELAEVLETDQAIAAKVLKIANSAYYGIIGGVSSIQQAAVVLGHRTLGDVITVAGSSNILGNTLAGYGLEAGGMWRHSMGVAFGSKIIANMKKPSLANDAFAAGLIHDVGKLILDQYILQRKEVFDEFMADGQHSFLNAEEHILGFDHSEIAFEVCNKWRVPETLTTAIRYHHYPSRSNDNELAYIVHMADALAMMTGLGLGIDGLLYKIDDKAEEFLGLKEEETNDIMAEIVESVEKISDQMH
jgi:HD-like signal output (HDOD) protein